VANPVNLEVGGDAAVLVGVVVVGDTANPVGVSAGSAAVLLVLLVDSKKFWRWVAAAARRAASTLERVL